MFPTHRSAMPPRTGGMRKLAEEKVLLAELAKMFHVAKAHHKEQQNTDKVAKKASGSTAAKDARRGSQRCSRQGGSIWMVLKGGFDPRAVPLASNTAVVEARAEQRAALSEKRRAAALKEAEAYIESAWQRARESDLVSSENVPTEEGDAYLAEQYATASQMLALVPAGSFLHQLVESHSRGADTLSSSGGQKKTLPDGALSRVEWEDLCTREVAILYRYRTSATPSISAEDYFKEQQQAREQRYYFITAEPTEKAGADVAPTKCVVRLRDSQRNKHTSILSTAKAVNYFKSNLGQVLRKELAGSKLPRGGADEGDSVAAAGAVKTSHNTANANANAAHGSKKKRRR